MKACNPHLRCVLQMLAAHANNVRSHVELEKSKTPIGQAVTYARNRRIQLARCFDDRRIPLDNGEVERLIRLIAIMRNNSLFVGSDGAVGGR